MIRPSLMPLPEAQAYFTRKSIRIPPRGFHPQPDRSNFLFPQGVTEAAGRPVFPVDWRQRILPYFNAFAGLRNLIFLILP